MLTTLSAGHFRSSKLRCDTDIVILMKSRLIFDYEKFEDKGIASAYTFKPVSIASGIT